MRRLNRVQVCAAIVLLGAGLGVAMRFNARSSVSEFFAAGVTEEPNSRGGSRKADAGGPLVSEDSNLGRRSVAGDVHVAAADQRFAQQSEPLAWSFAKDELRELIPTRSESDLQEFTRSILAWDYSGAELPDLELEYLNPEHKTVSEGDRFEIGRIISRHDEVLREQAEVSCELLLVSLSDYFELEKFARAYGEDPPRLDRGANGSSLYTLQMLVGAKGWVVRVDFRSEDYPPFQEQLEWVEKLRRARGEEVREYIANLPSQQPASAGDAPDEQQ